MSNFDTLVMSWRQLDAALELAGVPPRARTAALVLLVLSQFCDHRVEGRLALSAGAFAHATMVVNDELEISLRAYNGALSRLERAGAVTVLFHSDAGLIAALEGEAPHDTIVVRLDSWRDAERAADWPSAGYREWAESRRPRQRPT